MHYSLVLTLALLLLIPGIAVSFLPALSGLVYMLVVAVLFGWYDHFTHITGHVIFIFGMIALCAMVIDTLAGIIGAKFGGAHWSSLIYGFIGLIFGSFFVPVPFVGSLIGMFIGIMASEWYRTHDSQKAIRAALGSFAGTMVGTIVKVVCAVAFFGLFIFYAVH